MPLSSYGPASSWNADGPAQTLTVICGGELHGREIAKTSRDTQDAARLSHMRYTGGVTGYLEVLTNEANAFSAELGLV
jgi:hypothetical protein